MTHEGNAGTIDNTFVYGSGDNRIACFCVQIVAAVESVLMTYSALPRI